MSEINASVARVRELRARIHLNFKQEIDADRLEFLTAMRLVAGDLSQNLLVLGESMHTGHTEHVRQLLGAIALDDKLNQQNKMKNSTGDTGK